MVDSRSVALYKRRVYSGIEGWFLGGSQIDLFCSKRGEVYSEREG